MLQHCCVPVTCEFLLNTTLSLISECVREWLGYVKIEFLDFGPEVNECNAPDGFRETLSALEILFLNIHVHNMDVL